VPSGNFGNALGGYYAKKMGLAIDKIVIASNVNNVLTEWVNNGVYDLTTKELIQTSSPAMDILKSSNVERVLFDKFGAKRTAELMKSLEENGKYTLTEEELEKIKKDFIATSCNDEEGFEYIKEYANKGYIMDTHTATAIKAYKTLNSNNIQVAYSTAEWTKFAPSLYRALIEDKKVHDKEALETISEKYNVSVPKMVKELFTKPITQKIIVEKDGIEKAIVEFL